jgi:hypothetical protein
LNAAGAWTDQFAAPAAANSANRTPIVGFDPCVDGFFRLTGQGG